MKIRLKNLIFSIVGRNGHIGFNEPGTLKSSKKGNKNYNSNIPHQIKKQFLWEQKPFLTKKIILVAWGSKSKIIKRSIEEKENDIVPPYSKEITHYL